MSKKKYTLEFKQEAVNLVTQQGYSQAEAGKSLGINPVNISRWIKELSGKAVGLKEKNLLSVEPAELIHLRKEVKRLKLEREILKKAAAFFANEPA
jgi:transposase